MTESISTGFAPLNGTAFYYEIYGQGEPVVLLHAGICDGRMWDEQFEALGQHYQVIRYDRRGFGQTKLVAGDYAHHVDLNRLLDYLNISQAHLVGCSQGGKISLNFALEYPTRVKSLILVASALGGFDDNGPLPQQWPELEAADTAGDIARVNELELQIWVDGPHRDSNQVPSSLRERVRAMNLIALSAPTDLGQEQDLEPAAITRLGELHHSALIIVGELDTPDTLAKADLLAQTLVGAQKIVIPQTAHLPNMEQPEIFNRLVMDFLSPKSTYSDR